MVGKDAEENMSGSIRVGLIGWGTVGCGVIQVLRENATLIQDRLGRPIELVRVADMDLERERPVAVPAEMLTSRAEDILDDPQIDIVIELIGGLGAAKRIILQALDRKKYVVTANKALLAHAGDELFDVARNTAAFRHDPCRAARYRSDRHHWGP